MDSSFSAGGEESETRGYLRRRSSLPPQLSDLQHGHGMSARGQGRDEEGGLAEQLRAAEARIRELEGRLSNVTIAEVR